MSESNLNNHIAIEDLSAFADGQITDTSELERIEQHLAECRVCREELEEMRVMSRLLAELPEPELPRSFRLSPADIPESPAPDPTPIDPWIVRQQSRFRIAAMAAALLLALVVTIDLLPEESDAPGEAPVSMMEQAEDEAVEESAPEADAPDEPDAGIMDAEDADEPVTEEDESAAEPEADTPEEDRDQDAAAPEDEADGEEAEDRAAESEAAPAEDEPETRDVVAADEPSDGVSTLRIAAIVLGIVTAFLLAAGFIIPRWWQSSARQ